MVLLYPIYFGFAMKASQPFNFPLGLNTTVIFKNYVFSNNNGKRRQKLILTVK